MPKVNCELIMCKHNSSNVARGKGKCNCTDDISLVYKEYETDEGLKEGIMCTSFDWDYNKK